MQTAEQIQKVAVTLPDGSVRDYDAPVTGLQIAESIGKRLAKDALAVKIDGTLRDLTTSITTDAAVEIVTRDHADTLGLIRHDAAHVMAEAVQSLYPGTQVTIGPAIANGFYYDFARSEPFTPDDLEKIEAKMREIISRDARFEREVWDRDEAIRFFEERGEKYKAELIRDLPGTEDISVYRQGEWLDLCRGPHMPSTGRIGQGFKLTKVAGAYWRGDHRNAMLQRIYGTAWRDEKELKAYLHQLEEAEKRDHRRLGREMDLFHLQEEAVGAVFWHDKGYTLWRTLENYIRARLERTGYLEVKTPQLIDRALWVASGHWEKFREAMFTTNSDEEKVLALKPMNCPAHVQIYRQGIKSYRDLPLRMAEFGSCHRNEPSGSLHGIMRVRAFTQDDAHIFCTPEQITSESIAFCDLLLSVYKDLGFIDVSVKFSDRPATRAGTDEVWDRAEGALREAIEAAGLPYTMNPGEGAFYGPKLEFVLRDAIGRDWQCGTLQVDFVLPERLDAEYVGEDGARHRPVMLHRAILGSMERFIGMLIEHYAGKFPLWLAPLQVVVATITNDADEYGAEVLKQLRQAGIRAVLDTRNEKINFKVREHSLAKVPLMVVVGRRESDERTVALRRLGGKDQEVLALDAAVNTIVAEAGSPLGNLVPESPF
ncbi:threonine--tRNA ligase [Skermanella aerolata]|uniref:Threonine--tRNA ligase n=1 Tax=Skermanella aerolata TaxID=393310 RepID=A0A512DXU1_9PROT|nr:threonine--tRNA ligase [Skermanella aerolata]KJB93855.1 threonyl-tRNA synthetase [Skermanella aerolata KACC 11604]GEO41297.1 threonine--tRNA ligase [Skermanella aerolata]